MNIVELIKIYTQTKDTTVSEEEFNFVHTIVADACMNLNTFRRQEGQALENEFTERIEEIRRLLKQVDTYESVRIDIIKERMRKGLEETGSVVGFDENRFQQELIFYIEKLDISKYF